MSPVLIKIACPATIDIDDENEIELKGREKAEEKIFRGREENFTENTHRKK